MIRFNRPLGPIKALSFDLDDTLYANENVLLKAESSFLNYLHQHCPETKGTELPHWRRLRFQALEQQPELKHDVTKLRIASVELGLTQLGVSPDKARNIAESGFSYFQTVRSQISVPHENIQLLQLLRKKYPVVAVSNGNLDMKQAGIEQYFDAGYFAGKWLSKPEPDMLAEACRNLSIQANSLLHIGDMTRYDVLAARRFGAQSVWLNQVGHKPKKFTPHVLADVEITDFLDLKFLL